MAKTKAGGDYAERDEASYTSFTALRGRLLGDKGSAFQCRFLAAAQDTSSFLEFMDKEVPPKLGEHVALLDCALTEQSFKDMTADQEQIAFSKWHHLPPRVACRVSFWAETTIQHLRGGSIREAYWLAANGGRNESGEERIDRALQLEGDRRAVQVDDCVRTILRRMSGLPSARGNRSVFVNCSLARAWWRGRLVSRISARDGTEDRRAISNVVRSSQQYWENLVKMIVSRGSVLGSVDAQDAFINALAGHLRAQGDSPLWSANSVDTVSRRFSNIAAARELGALEFEEICGIARVLIEQVAEIKTATG